MLPKEVAVSSDGKESQMEENVTILRLGGHAKLCSIFLNSCYLSIMTLLVIHMENTDAGSSSACC